MYVYRHVCIKQYSYVHRRLPALHFEFDEQEVFLLFLLFNRHTNGAKPKYF